MSLRTCFVDVIDALAGGGGGFAQTPARIPPSSPIFRGISAFNPPPQWGGNRAEGLKLLQQSADALAQPDLTVPGPYWGPAEVLPSLGVTPQKSGDADAGRTAWKQTRALEPEYAWVKDVLLPSLANAS